ncbi:MAG: NADH-quinone oxidoreductase subunit F, partial [Peptococcaceae bacterium]|nr:NADH-quinone oxidoreductase subunit F [Peptococcaceae bacterium]
MLNSRVELDDLKKKALLEISRTPKRILVCAGTGCVANGSLKVFELFKQLLAQKPELKLSVELDKEDHHNKTSAHISGCHGFCQMGPLVRIEPRGTLYCKVKPEDVSEIFEEHIINGRVVTRLLYQDDNTHSPIETQDEIPFYKNQLRVALANCGRINPDDIEDYIAHNGYQSLAR